MYVSLVINQCNYVIYPRLNERTNNLQPQVKNQKPIKRSRAQVSVRTHRKALQKRLYADVHLCKRAHTLPAFSKTSLWTAASASAAINHAEDGGEGKAHLVHVAPTPGLNKP